MTAYRSVVACFCLCLVRTQAFASSDLRALSADDEAELAKAARVDTVVRLALERNADTAELRARTDAAVAGARAATRLPDLEAKYEQWGVPIRRPVSLGQADSLMFGVRQSIPAWGTRAARSRAAQEDIGMARAGESLRQQDLSTQVRRAHAAYFRAGEELRLHGEHVDMLSRILELARLNQQAGRGGLADVLRLQLEITRLHTDVARLERDRRSNQALLNVLMNRAPEATLGPAEQPPLPVDASASAMDAEWEARRPDLAVAERSVLRNQALLDEAKQAAVFPTVMVGVDYWYMPMGPEHHAYGAMVGVNLPWLSGRADDEIEAAEQNLRAQVHARESARHRARFEVEDARAGVTAARKRFALIDQTLLVQARQSLEATQGAYANGHGDAMDVLDALRAYLETRIERINALVDLFVSLADLDRAAGRAVPNAANAATETATKGNAP